MKKKYLIPEVEITKVTLEEHFLASGENLSGRNYGTKNGEDDDCFWE